MVDNQPIPVVIFAQSGRFLAQSASQAGYSVWVADCYGDTDLLTVADRWQPLPSFAELTHDSIINALSKLTNNEQCMLICGSGIELCYHLLRPLPANIQLIGNTPGTIQSVKTPTLFFDVLDQHAINYPETQFKAPYDDLSWLKKQASGLGGSHIQYLTLNTDKINAETYYQRFIAGSSGSCLFLADGRQAQIISINRQYVTSDSQMPFQLSRIESAWQLPASHNDHLYKVANQLTAATALVGLNSLDFIISDKNELLILEVNPRASASAELVKNQNTLFKQHIDACLGQLPHSQSLINQNAASLFYHYATSDHIIPVDMLWPTECHDLPIAGSIIKQGEPICTSCVDIDDNNSAIQSHLNIEQKILKQLIPTS